MRLRLRLTLVYGGLFLALGAVLLGVNYALVRQGVEHRSVGIAVPAPAPGDAQAALPFDVVITPDGQPIEGVLQTLESNVRSQALDELLSKSLLALGLMSIVSVGVGWMVAGRALRPLQDISATARRLSEHDLHERINLDGPPDDELVELADTIDAMLARLEAAFASQKRFVANASHELRTPLAIQRTLVDVALADPDASPDDLRRMAVQVRDAVDRSERLIDSLLVLAQSERGELPRREAVDLGATAGRAVEQQRAEIDRLGLELDSALVPAPVEGSPVLVERLVANLVENAVRHNHARGWIRVSTAVDADRARSVLRVANSGPIVEPRDVDGLFEPFRRGDGERVESSRGVGLGLSIVRAVATAHGGSVRADARADGDG
ncbi:MAG: sensor histidine kinase, partial [Acidimicrobiales bacterium]